MSDDDSWLRELAQVNREQEARERSRLDERWDRLSAGELSPQEEAELRALAETSEEARQAYEAFRPLGDEFQARMVSTLAAEVASPASAETAKPARFRLLPFRPAARFGTWLSAAAAVAAVLFLLLRSPAALPPLPAYVGSLSPGVQPSRGPGSTTGRQVFVPGSPLTLEAAPQRSVTGPVEAAFFLERGAELTPWTPKPSFFEIADGSVRLHGTVGTDFRLDPGDWRIWVVVGRPGKMPSLDELQTELRAGRTRHAGWQAVSTDLRIASRASP
jgi:hypothetical protein